MALKLGHGASSSSCTKYCCFNQGWSDVTVHDIRMNSVMISTMMIIIYDRSSHAHDHHDAVKREILNSQPLAGSMSQLAFNDMLNWIDLS